MAAAAKTKKKSASVAGRKVVAQNRRARHDYDILDTFEAGIALVGSEVKSLREGKCQLKDSYARVERGEAWLLGVHIPPYLFANGFGAHDPERTRKLLLHRREIEELRERSQQEALTHRPAVGLLREGQRQGRARPRPGPQDVRQAARPGRAGRQAGSGARSARPVPLRMIVERSSGGVVTAGRYNRGVHLPGGDRLRLWSTKREKRAVVSGATLKSRKNNKRQANACTRCLKRSDVSPAPALRAGTGRH